MILKEIPYLGFRSQTEQRRLCNSNHKCFSLPTPIWKPFDSSLKTAPNPIYTFFIMCANILINSPLNTTLLVRLPILFGLEPSWVSIYFWAGLPFQLSFMGQLKAQAHFLSTFIHGPVSGPGPFSWASSFLDPMLLDCRIPLVFMISLFSF